LLSLFGERFVAGIAGGMGTRDSLRLNRVLAAPLTREK